MRKINIGQRCKAVVEHDRAERDVERAETELTAAIKARKASRTEMAVEIAIMARRVLEYCKDNLRHYGAHA